MTKETAGNILEAEKVNNQIRQERAIAALTPLRQGYEKLLEDKGKRVRWNMLRIGLVKAFGILYGIDRRRIESSIFKKEIGEKDPVTVVVENYQFPGNTIQVRIEGHDTELRLREDLENSHVFLGTDDWRDLDELDIKYYSDLLQILQN
ncbi:hypothetical protein HY502_00895 [Candidatus Woesebacteria bacterium]|nr:hypothetical protein [Candidatus Woesebacteria bacterium]